MAAKAFDIRYPGISVYEALTSKDLSEEEKAKIVAEAIDSLSKEFPNLKHVATQNDVTQTELKLTKEIEIIRKEIKELELRLSQNIQDSELRLTKEIEDTKKEIKELDLKLTKEIKELDVKLTKEIEDTRKEIKELDLKLTKEIKELDVKLTKEIEDTKKEIKELDLKLTKEIKELDIKSSKERDAIKLALTKEIENTKFTMLKWQFIFWASQMGVILTIAYKILSIKG